MMPSSASDMGCEALALDGSVLRIRPVQPTDEQVLRGLNSRVSDRSIFLRFFAPDRRTADRYARKLVRPADDDHFALVALLGDGAIGVAGYERTGPAEAEVAFMVEDTQHGKGIGTLLLEHLASHARRHGIRDFVAMVLPENAAMQRVFSDSGFPTRQQTVKGVVEIHMSTTPSERTLEAIDQRERLADVRSLAALFEPRSVAVVRAGGSLDNVGQDVVVNLIRAGFSGAIHPISSSTTQVAGLPAYPSITAVPDRIDLVVVAVPAPSLTDVIDHCGRRGVRAAIVVTASPSARGQRGVVEQRLRRLARSHGMRLIGPDSIGVVNTDPRVSLNASLVATPPAPGRLAVAAQSGTVGRAMLDRMPRSGLGIACFVALGTKADVSGNDLLLEWDEDPRVGVIALHLESLGNPRKFARIARRVARRKPVLVVTGRRSAGRRRAGRTQTPTITSPEAAVDALFAQAGVLRVDTVDEVIATAQLLDGQPLPAGGRVAIVGNVGHAVVLAAASAEALGLEVPGFSTGLRRRLTRSLVGVASVDNPLDLGAATRPPDVEHALDEIAGSAELDAVIAIFTATPDNDPDGVARAVHAVASRSVVPILAVFLGLPEAGEQFDGPRPQYLPIHGRPELAVRALSHAVRYSRWRNTPLGEIPDLPDVAVDDARRLVADVLHQTPRGSWVDHHTASKLLGCYGVRGAAGREMASKSDAAVSGAVHVVVSLIHEPSFGPLLSLGLGRIRADLLGDRVLRILPLTTVAAAEMVRGLRASEVLFDVSGGQPVDVHALEELLLRVGKLAVDVPEIAELDLDPVTISPSGIRVVDMRLRLAPAAEESDPYLRQLRS